MATCKDCIHYEVCGSLGMEVYRWGRKPTLQIFLDKYKAEHCTRFKDRARFVELPDIGDYDTVTTIDEAIDHCYQIATSTDETVCAECKAEHMRLCGWLGDLKRRIAAEQALKECENSV